MFLTSKSSINKYYLKFTLPFIICIIFVSVFAFTAKAANTSDTSFSFKLNLAGYTRNSEVRKKENSSAIYFYWTGTTGSSTSINVRILGGSSVDDATTKCTSLASGELVDHVICYYGVQQSVHSMAYEQNIPNVRFSLRTGGTATVSGKWSPDSTKNYTDAVN